jgi:hypothetical protein
MSLMKTRSKETSVPDIQSLSSERRLRAKFERNQSIHLGAGRGVQTDRVLNPCKSVPRTRTSILAHMTSVHECINGELRNSSTILVRRPEGMGQLKRLTRKWNDNIKMELTETECEHKEGIHVVQNCEHTTEPLGSTDGG